MIKKGQLFSWAKTIYPYNRSLTGLGVRKTLKFLKKINPNLKIHKVTSQKKVFDWNIPLEWEIKDAYVTELKTKKKVIDFKKNNLHIVGYSISLNKKLSLEQLSKNLYSIPEQPNFIPYITSYYKKNWGFCLKHKDKKKLKKGLYHAVIKSKLFKGKMNYADLIIKGKQKREIVFSTYICHPSMANNEVSGPIVASGLAKYIKHKFKEPKYTYRFIFAPETIGAINYIKKNFKVLTEKVAAGFVLTCVGDERCYSYIKSRKGDTLADKAIALALKGKKKIKVYSYLDRGSDERQYCYPGIDLPFVTFCRSKFGTYPEYHTSADDFNLVTKNGLNQSLDVLKKMVDKLEEGKIFKKENFSKKININKTANFKNLRKYKTKTLCEPNMGKRNLYPTISRKENYKIVKKMMNVLAYSDGEHDINDMSLKLKIPLSEIKIIVKKLLKAQVIY